MQPSTVNAVILKTFKERTIGSEQVNFWKISITL